MIKVKIIYDPERLSSLIIKVGEKDITKLGTRYQKITNYIKKEVPLQKWIKPIENEKWEGFLAEIIGDSDETDLELTFLGRDSDFKYIQKALVQQSKEQDYHISIEYIAELNTTDENYAQKIDEVAREIQVAIPINTTNDFEEKETREEFFERVKKEVQVGLDSLENLSHSDVVKSNFFSVEASVLTAWRNYVLTLDFKMKLQKGQICNKHLASYILEADFVTKFVEGVRDRGKGGYLIIFVSDGLFVPLKNDLMYARYDKVRGVEEDVKQLTILLDDGYLSCGDELINVNGKQICIEKSYQNTKVIRQIRHYLEKVIEVKDGNLPNVENAIKEIIKMRIGRISKSSPSHFVDDFSDGKVKGKLRKALAKYALKVRRDDAIAFIDTSLFGGGGAGLLFSNDGIAFVDAFEKVFLKYNEIEYLVFGKKNKELIFKGEFSEREDYFISPSINDIHFNLEELKECIEEIQCKI